MVTQQREPPLHKDRSAPKVILIVEDDPVSAECLTAIILQETSHCVFVADSSGALHFVRHVKPDLFLIDYFLPGMNGIALYDHLHVNRELAEIPAIIINASLETCLDEIFARHLVALPKPLDFDDFLSTLEAVLA